MHGHRWGFWGHDVGDEGFHAGARGRGRGGPHHPGGPFGFGPPGGNPFGFGGGFPWSFLRGGPGPRARRGDVRAGILALLNEQPRNGYQIMQELEQRSHGMWRPSPGSIYPALQQLEDEGLVEQENKLYKITAAGKKHLKDEGGDTPPWENFAEAASDDVVLLVNLMRQTGQAAVQVLRSGNPAQIAAARKVLVDTRKALYRILAEDEPDDD